MEISHCFVDGELIVEKRPYGQNLIAFVDQYIDEFGNSDTERETYVSLICDKRDKKYNNTFDNIVGQLSKDLKVLLQFGQKKELGSLWNCLRIIDKRSGNLEKQSKLTYVRNGLAKLMLFPDDIRPLVYNFITSGEIIECDLIPRYLENLKLIQIGLDETSFEIDSNEIVNLVESLGRKKCETAIATMPKRMHDFAQSLYCVENSGSYTDFVVENYSELTTAKGVADLLIACYNNPVDLLKGRILKYKPIDTWLFSYAMTIKKAETGKVLAYGLSYLSKDSGIKDSRIRFLGPKFLWRQDSFTDIEIDAISGVFAKLFSSISKKQFDSMEFRRSMYLMLLQRAFYTLSNYRNYEPLRDITLNALKAAGINCKLIKQNTALSEFSGSTAATTDFIFIPPDTLIYWQTVTEAGRIHKTKELSARFRSTKAKWNGKTFLPRSSAEYIYFIADGEWRSEDFDMLVRSGIEKVFYPDEIDRLIDLIDKPNRIKIEDVDLPLAAETKKMIKLESKRKKDQIRKSKAK